MYSRPGSTTGRVRAGVVRSSVTVMGRLPDAISRFPDDYASGSAL
jgi:hypothetical protein